MAAASRPAPIASNWAETGDQTEPSDSFKASGWPLSGVPPTRQKFNWILGWISQGVRYLLHRGLPDYDTNETYAVGDIVQYSVGTYADWLTYRCTQANGGANVQNPSDPSYWERWGFSASAADGRIDSKLGTLSGVLSSGVAASAGASVVFAHTFNFPNTTYKILVLKLSVPLTGGNGSTVVTLSGNVATFNTTALSVIGSGPATSGGPIVAGEVNSANVVSVEVTNMADAESAAITVQIAGH
jgi:hypothetical protein